MKNGRNAGARNGSPADPAPAHAPGGRIDIAPMEIDIAKDHLGTTLSSRRHALGLRIEDVAEDIKVRAEYLRALEQEELQKLPTPQHARLFVKSYAERLGLNVAEVYALHDLCESPVKVKPGPDATAEPPSKPPPSPGSGVPVWVWVVGAIAVLVVVVVVWLFSRGGGPDSTRTAGVALPTPTEESTPPAPEPAAASTTVPAPAMTIVVRFARDTWVRLIADGDTLESAIVGAGQSTEAPAKSRIELSLGHVLGVEGTINGQPLTPYLVRAIGPGGLVMTPDSLAAWFGGVARGGQSDSASTPEQSDTL